MAGNWSDYMENALLSWFKNTAFPAVPTNFYVGLLTVAPGDTGTTGGTADGTEVAATNGYARVAISPASGWSAISAVNTTGQQIANAGTITFPTPTGSWGTVVAIGIYDAATAGHLIAWAPQTPSQTIASGNTVSISAGGLIFQID